MLWVCSLVAGWACIESEHVPAGPHPLLRPGHTTHSPTKTSPAADSKDPIERPLHLGSLGMHLSSASRQRLPNINFFLTPAATSPPRTRLFHDLPAFYQQLRIRFFSIYSIFHSFSFSSGFELYKNRLFERLFPVSLLFLVNL